MVILEAEVKTLRTANEALNKQKRIKKTRVRAEGSFNVLKIIAL